MMNDRYPKIKLREYPEYVPHSTVGLTLSAAAYSFGAGVLASAVKNTLLKPKNAGYLHPKTGFYVYLFSMFCCRWLVSGYGEVWFYFEIVY